MGAILNGMALVKVRALRLGLPDLQRLRRGRRSASARSMEMPVIYVFTHDSIGVGEDGPTHQPIEQLASLRAIPGLIVLRPADANEVVEAWKVIMQLHHEPAVLVLTRQALPTLDRTKYAAGLRPGARAPTSWPTRPAASPTCSCWPPAARSRCASQAYEQLKAEGIKARVVSMPSWELFDDQPQAYRDSVLPPDVTARVSVEQASTFGWAQYVGRTRRTASACAPSAPRRR